MFVYWLNTAHSALQANKTGGREGLGTRLCIPMSQNRLQLTKFYFHHATSCKRCFFSEYTTDAGIKRQLQLLRHKRKQYQKSEQQMYSAMFKRWSDSIYQSQIVILWIFNCQVPVQFCLIISSCGCFVLITHLSKMYVKIQCAECTFEWRNPAMCTFTDPEGETRNSCHVHAIILFLEL